MRFIACVALGFYALGGLGGLGGCKSDKQVESEGERRLRGARVRSFQRARARALARQRRLARLTDAVAGKTKVLRVPGVPDGGVTDASTADADANQASGTPPALIGEGPPRKPYDGKPNNTRPALVAFQKWDRLPAKQRKAIAPVVNASTSFTLDLLGQLGRRRENISLAPWSLWSGLVTLTSGATGTTRKQLRRLLHLAVDDDTLRKQWTRLNNQHARGLRLGGLKLRAASGLWVHQGVKLRPAASKRGFGVGDASVRRIDIKADPVKACKAMNSWIGSQVGTGSGPLVGQGVVHVKVRLLLTSAVTLTGALGKLFSKGGTIPGTFYLPECQMVQVPMMNSRPMKYFTSRSRDVELVDIPLGGGAISLTVMMPPRHQKLAGFQAKLTSAKLRWWFGTLAAAKGRVTLPRLELGASWDLAATLKTLGAKAPFSKGATFGNLADPGKLSLETVLHRTPLVLRELGMATPHVPRPRPIRVRPWRRRRLYRPPRGPRPRVWRDFYADRPFLLLLRHRTTGAILILVRIYNPLPGSHPVKNPACVSHPVLQHYPYYPPRRRRQRRANLWKGHFVRSTAVLGGLDGEDVRKAMKKQTDAIVKCVTKGQKAKPPLKGTVRVRFTIRRNGTVGEVHMTFGKRRHASTGACLRTEVRRWKFGKNREEPTVVGFTVGSRR